MHDRWPDIIEASQKERQLGSVVDTGKSLAMARDIFLDIPWLEGSDRFSHRAHVRTSVFEIRTTCTAYGKCPATPQAVVSMLFYGNQWEEKTQSNGFAALFNTIDYEAAQCARNVIDGGADGGSSIWIVGWRPGLVDVRYPPFSEAGIVGDEIHFALSVLDWRQVVRVANVGALTTPELESLIVQAACRVKSIDSQTRIYAPGHIVRQLEDWNCWGKTGLRGVREVPELRTDEPRVV
jgi:hypothetical protein